MNVVLVNPEIPQNTGNIARTCAATGAMLHLVKPLGFSLDDRYLRRAGLDYWHMMRYRVYEDFGELLRATPDATMHYLSTKAARVYSEVAYGPDDFLVFGCETRGLPENLLSRGKNPFAPADAPEEPPKPKLAYILRRESEAVAAKSFKRMSDLLNKPKP